MSQWVMTLLYVHNTPSKCIMALLWAYFIMYYYSHLCHCCFPSKLFKFANETLTSTSNQYCSMAWNQEQVRGDQLWRSCSLFLIGIFDLSFGLVKYPNIKQFTWSPQSDHSLTCSCYIIPYYGLFVHNSLSYIQISIGYYPCSTLLFVDITPVCTTVTFHDSLWHHNGSWHC